MRGDETNVDLPPDAQAILRRLESDLIDEDDVSEAWFTRLSDPPNLGPVRPEVAKLVPVVMAA